MLYIIKGSKYKNILILRNYKICIKKSALFNKYQESKENYLKTF